MEIIKELVEEIVLDAKENGYNEIGVAFKDTLVDEEIILVEDEKTLEGQIVDIIKNKSFQPKIYRDDSGMLHSWVVEGIDSKDGEEANVYIYLIRDA